MTSARAALRRRPVVAWALYDWANSAFACTVMAGFFPVFFKQYWNAGVPATESTFRLGITSGIASLLIALLAPFIGAIADRSSARLRLLLAFTVLGSAATVALALVPQGSWLAAAMLFLVASLGFWGGIVFNDSLLLHVAEPHEYDLVSGFGYAMGYLGGGLLFAVNVVMTQKPEWFGLANAADAVRWSFVTVGAWWLLFALPCVLIVKERATPGAASSWLDATRQGWRELAGTAREIRRYRVLVWFLAAYILYIDGVNTVIKMAVDYGLSLGFDQSHLIKALLLTQFVAFPAALGFGWLGSRIGARNGIFLAIGVYFAATVYAYQLDTKCELSLLVRVFGDAKWIQIFRGLMGEACEFYFLAFVIGLVQGGIQSLSRSYYGRLVPREKSSEFFGFYNMMGKASAILGPMLVGTTAALTGSSRLSILSILLLFIGGAALLLVARRAEQQAA